MELLTLIWNTLQTHEFWTAFVATSSAAIGGLNNYKKSRAANATALKAADECAQLKSDFARLKALLDDVQEELDRKSDELKALRADSEAKDKKIKMLETRLEEKTAEIAELNSKLSAAISEVEYLRKREREQSGEITRLTRANVELTQRLKTKKPSV
jgi:chromosome segregation ATPase